MVGVLQLAVGALRLGALAHFISPAALRGFTGGAALLIAVHALKDLLGIVMPAGLSAPAALALMAERLPQFNPGALVVGAATMVAGARREAPVAAFAAPAAGHDRRHGWRPPRWRGGRTAGIRWRWSAWCRRRGRIGSRPRWTGAACPSWPAWRSR